MNSTIFRQFDSRWGSLAYPGSGSTVSNAGCGLVACTHIAIEQDAKKNWTPKALRPWMIKQGYAIAGQGTTWNGITATLRYLGHTDVVCIWSDPISDAWKELNKGNRMGILLLSAGKCPDGTVWTTGGHYVAFINYKTDSKGQHWFYVKDSGSRIHDGWFCYEKSMKGHLPKVWIVKRLKGKVGSGYTGEFPSNVAMQSTHHASEINSKALEFAFPYGTAKKNYTYPSAKPITVCKNAIAKVWDTSGWSAQMKAGADCAVFVGAVIGILGIDRVSQKCKTAITELRKSDKWEKVTGTTDSSAMSAGTIGCWTKEKSQHIFIIVEKDGTKYIAEASHPSKYYGRLSKKAPTYTASKYKTLEFYAPKEEVTILRNYLKLGDKGTQISKWQKFLNWYFGNVLSVDGIFGEQTLKYTKKFQTEQGLTADGLFGAKTLAKAKAVTK